jgi:tricorn protease-like protein
MQCPHCHQEHPTGSLFCPVTGKKIILPGICPHCGQPVEPNWRNCTSCGRSLVQEKDEAYQPTAQAAGFPKTRWLIIAGGVVGLLCLAAVIISSAFWIGAQQGQTIPNTENAPTETTATLATSALSETSTPAATRAFAASTQYTGKILFASAREGDDASVGSSKIYAMNADGSQQEGLGNLGWSESPSLSADGQKIVFVSGDKDGSGIYVMEADGRQPTRITPKKTGYYDLAPCWSGDGNKIAFTSNRDGNYEIYSMDADGSHPQRLTYFQADDIEPAWSADGKKIAFTSFRDGYMDIYSMNADGSDPKRLTTNRMEDSHPNWSADGQKIVFQSYREGSQYMSIYVMDADGSNQTPLINNYSTDSFPIWLGDGKIAFVSERDGNEEIYSMNADGSEQTRLTENSVSDTLRSYPNYYIANQQPSLPQQPALPLP